MSLNGNYIVNGTPIKNKLQALLEASKTTAKVQWTFFDEIFESATKKFNKHEISLKELYRDRAQQLRDSYDYLILNYSGGSDSHNILMTFLEYGIKLDHIYIQWPEKLMDKGIYTPNAIDRTNANFHSEWDLVIKKDLEWLAKNHPEIKIEINDWTTTVKEQFYKDDIFANDVSNLPSIARAQKQNTFSTIEGTLALQGKKVASIFGVDKPCVVKQKNQWFFYFVDTACMAQPNPDNPHGTEYFYWSPNFPDIAIAQALAMKNYFEINKKNMYLVQSPSERALIDPTFVHMNYEKHYFEYSIVSEISKLVCYPYWDFNRFQADKPFAVLDGFKMGTRAWDNILTHVPDFDRVQQAWSYHWKSYLNQIDSRFMRNRDTLKYCQTKWHYLCNSTDNLINM
jgi:hypothetical protein